MAKDKRPYLRQKNAHTVHAIFNSTNNIFVEKMLSYCIDNNLKYYITKTSVHDRVRYAITGKTGQINRLKLYIKNSYDEFHHYDRVIKKEYKREIQEIQN